MYIYIYIYVNDRAGEDLVLLNGLLSRVQYSLRELCETTNCRLKDVSEDLFSARFARDHYYYVASKISKVSVPYKLSNVLLPLPSTLHNFLSLTKKAHCALLPVKT